MGNHLNARTRALKFHSTSLHVVRRDGEVWLRLHQIEGALGYKGKGRGLALVFQRNTAEFTDRMTQLVTLPTAGGPQEVRVFSLRGAHLLAMFARTERAAEFRRWVLDVLDQQAPSTAPPPPAQRALPAPAPAPAAVALAAAPITRRWLIEQTGNDAPVTRQAGADLVVGTWAEIADMLRYEASSVPRSEVMGLAEAATRAAFSAAANSPKGDGAKIARAIESAGDALALADLQAIATAATLELWGRVLAHHDGRAGKPGSGITALVPVGPDRPALASRNHSEVPK